MEYFYLEDILDNSNKNVETIIREHGIEPIWIEANNIDKAKQLAVMQVEQYLKLIDDTYYNTASYEWSKGILEFYYIDSNGTVAACFFKLKLNENLLN